MQPNKEAYCTDCTKAGLDSKIGYKPRHNRDAYGAELDVAMVPYCLRDANHLARWIKD